jgi:hypothetical protein
MSFLEKGNVDTFLILWAKVQLLGFAPKSIAVVDEKGNVFLKTHACGVV